MSRRSWLGPLGWRFLAALMSVVAAGIATLLVIWLVGTRVVTTDDLHLTPGWILVAGGLAMIVAALVAVWLSRRFTRPLSQAADMAVRFADGDHDVRLDSSAPGELGQLARSFNLVGETVSQSERDRRRMAADIAHELRTPLAVLQAGLEEARDGYVPADPENLACLHAQVIRLGRIVDDLADLAAAESNDLVLRPEELDLRDVCTAVIDEIAPTFDAAGIRLEMARGHHLKVLADPGRVHQILVNLLLNSARYCRVGDTARLTLGRGPGGVGLIEIRDTGPGIASTDLPRVFDRYWRGAGADRTGSGLGLPLVKRLVERQGGTITIASPQQRGTVVTVVLPRVEQLS